MKEFQEVLIYIDYYRYIRRDSEFLVISGPETELAEQAYSKAAKFYESLIVPEKDFNYVAGFNQGYSLRDFQIAIDCLRRLSYGERKLIVQKMYLLEFYYEEEAGASIYCYSDKISYAGLVNFIDYNGFETTEPGETVLRIILSILNPDYDFRNKLIGRLRDYSIYKLLKQYGARYRNVFNEEITAVVDGKRKCSFESWRSKLCDKLRLAAGPDDFKELFKEAYEEYINFDEKSPRKEDFWEIEFFNRAELYPLQARQTVILMNYHFNVRIKRGVLKSVSACQEYIDETFGFKEWHAKYLAQMFWEVCRR